MRFTKMHGIGNDYIYVNGFTETVADPASLSRAISDRHTGVGGDHRNGELHGEGKQNPYAIPPGQHRLSEPGTAPSSDRR